MQVFADFIVLQLLDNLLSLQLLTLLVSYLQKFVTLLAIYGAACLDEPEIVALLYRVFDYSLHLV